MTVRRFLRVLGSPPGQSRASGDNDLLSIALVGVVLSEILLCTAIIWRIPYTEIDWVAYMQEVKGFMDGERNYSNLQGDTGPLVYPAGFVYVYTVMYWLTDCGQDIVTAQYLFAGLYISLMMVVLSIYRRAAQAAMPLWSILLVCASKRVHSIFILRLFNDGVAMWLLYLAIYMFLQGRWRPGCVGYSLAVGVKMNILLFAPGLLLLLLQANGLAGTMICLSICAGVQLLLGTPFLAKHPVSYIARSFELGRVFKYEWTVNFKFLNEGTFVSPELSLILLAATVATLILFAGKWIQSRPTHFVVGDGRLSGHQSSNKHGSRALPPEYVAKTLFVSNFIGIVFCRSLHYQFYSWYYHTLPFLLWQTRFPVIVRLGVLLAMEWCFNVFPATPTSSAVLQACHLSLLVGLWEAPVSRGEVSSTKYAGASAKKA